MQSQIIFLVACLLGIAVAAEKVSVAYHVWNHPIPEEAVGNPGQPFEVEEGKTFGHVMDLAAELNPEGYGFNYTQFDFGRMITEIGGVSQDPGNDKYWMLYQLGAEPDTKNPPGQGNLTQYGVDGQIVKDKEIYLFWLTNTGHSAKQ